MAVLRVSGPQAAAASLALTGRPPPAPRRAALRRLKDPSTGEVIDETLVLWFPGPHSETGEDLLEIQHHGGPAVLAALLEVLQGLPGFRLASPGEFSRRAFLNGKLDLTAAEGLADLIEADTRAQARQAMRQLEGELGRLYADWRERLLTALALIEAEIDFAAEEEVPEAMLGRIAPELCALAGAMAGHLADGHRGERLRQGLTVAVVGAPNVGKSSLVNLLARRDVAIVTAIPGTTRDVIEVPLDLGGVPVVLLDTAGLREAADPVEAEGIARARRRAATADLVLHLADASDPGTWDAGEVGAASLVRVMNKIDLADVGTLSEGAIGISCRTGAGIPELLARLQATAHPMTAAGAAPLLTRQRHREAVTAAHAALLAAVAEAESTAELALAAENLRVAARSIGEITGAVGVEAVLDRIFATFCIGK